MAEYDKQYNPTVWKNYPVTDTSINAYRLNHLEGGVNENDNRLVALSEDKAEQTVVNKMVKAVTLNKATGVLTVTLLDGTKSTYDLDIEKVVANFDLNNNNDLVLTLADGTQKVVPLSKFVDTYTFKSSGTITFNTTGKEITAFIPDGSITLSKLEATVLSTIRQYMLDAQTAKGQAEQAAENARGYAIGGTGFEGVSAQYFANQAQRYAVITDEAPKDNAQYYAQDAAKSAEEARQAAGCDGTAASITATDVQGLVAAAGGNSNVQALINAVADQVINRLVAKGQIVNNLLATEPGSVLDATQGKTLKEYYDRLYSDLTDVKIGSYTVISNSYVSITTGSLRKVGKMCQIYLSLNIQQSGGGYASFMTFPTDFLPLELGYFDIPKCTIQVKANQLGINATATGTTALYFTYLSK